MIRKNKVDGPDMEYQPNVVLLDYCCGGSEGGKSKRFYLKDFEVEYNVDDGTVSESTQEKFDFLVDDYNALDDIVDKYNIKQWTNLEKNEIQVLDKETSSLTMEFKDGTIIKLGDNYQMNDDAKAAIKEILELFESHQTN